MRSIKFVILLVLIICFFQASLFSRISSRVEGTVIDKDTGQPIEGAEVHLFNVAPRPNYLRLLEWEKMTDKKGKFMFEVPAFNIPQSYYIQCKRKGYVSLIPDYYFRYKKKEKFPEIARFFVMGNGEIKHFVIELKKGGTLKGTILKREPTGVSPFGYVGAFLERKTNPNENYLEDYKGGYNIASIDADENGKFEVLGIEPFDDYSITFVIRGYVSKVLEDVKVEKNKIESIEHIIDLTNQTGIKGVIKIKQNLPELGGVFIKNIKMPISSLERNDLCSCRLDSDGNYSCIGINPGTYLMEVSASPRNDSGVYKKEFIVDIIEGKTKVFNINL